MLVRNPPAQVSMISARIATRQSTPGDYFGAELFHRRDLIARRRGRSDYYARHAYRGEFFDISRLQLFAQTTHRNFQWHGPLRRALMLSQTLDRRRDLVVTLRDSVPAVAEFRRPLEGRFSI